MEILRRGSEGDDTRRWQHFLLGQRLLVGRVDGLFGPATESATRAFQKRHRIEADGTVGPLTYAAGLRAGFDADFTDPRGGTSGAQWPLAPTFAPLVSNSERAERFGTFRFKRRGASGDEIRLLGDWKKKNIVRVTIPQLRGVAGAPTNGVITVHRLVRAQFQELFAAWQAAGLMRLVKTWDGCFVSRLTRGSSTTLSNHAWGAAFDINGEWNPRGVLPVLRSREGSVRELVPVANHYGFYWGGHLSRRDGSHFEVARVLG